MAYSSRTHRSPNSWMVKFYQLEEIRSKYSEIIQWLLKNDIIKQYEESFPICFNRLVNLALTILNIQEDFFGSNLADPHVVKIPIRCFRDLRAGGGLCQILLAAYKFMYEQNVHVCELELGQRVNPPDRLPAMFEAIKEALVQSDCFGIPIVYVRPEVDKNTTAKIKELIRRHGGTVTDDEGTATHVLYPPLKPDRITHFARPVFKEGENLLIHYCSTPDSQNSWRTLELPWEFPELRWVSCPPTFPYKLNAHWALDMEPYNEWMAEEDYEVDDSEQKRMHKYALSIKKFTALLHSTLQKPINTRPPSPIRAEKRKSDGAADSEGELMSISKRLKVGDEENSSQGVANNRCTKCYESSRQLQELKDQLQKRDEERDKIRGRRCQMQ